VFVFDDRLDYWCDQGYDSIGAPWLASTQTASHRLLLEINNAFRKNTSKKSNAHYFRVGNGGFSLRNTKAMLRAVARRQQHMADTSSPTQAHPKHLHIEDLYFSLVAPTLVDMKIPDYREAVDFCLDRRPKLGLKLNRGKLPFACHRCFDPKAIKLWQPFIQACREPYKFSARHPRMPSAGF